MDYKSSAELKRLARGQLKGKYGLVVGTYLATLAIIFAIEIPISLIFKSETTAAIILNYLISMILSLLFTVLTLGLIKFYLNITRNKPATTKDIFWGIYHHPDKIIVASLLLFLMYFIVALPASIGFSLYFITKNIGIFLFSILLFIVTIVLIIILTLSFSLIYYILADNPEKSSIQALRESRVLMKNNRGRLFYLYISFFGWYLLGLLSCGIGFLWISPYFQVTLAYFYMDLRGELRLQNQSTFTVRTPDSSIQSEYNLDNK